jgi:putative DNA primase/helicase
MPDTSHLNINPLSLDLLQPDPPTLTSRPPFAICTAADLLSTAFPPREMVLGPWLPQKGLAMLYGSRGIGKTHLTLGIAYSVATGGTFLRWTSPRPRRVLVIDGEMPANVMQERLAAIAARSDREPPSPEHLRFLAMDLQDRGGINLAEPSDQAALEAQLDGAELIIIDNLSTCTQAGRENEAESWLPVQEWALRQRRADRTVLFIHHAGKGGQQRGTSRREDVLDSVIALRKPNDAEPEEGARFEVHFEKSRGFCGDDAKPFEASLGRDGWITRDLADADMARVVALQADGLSIRDIAAETGMSKSKVDRLAKRAIATGYTTPERTP